MENSKKLFTYRSICDIILIGNYFSKIIKNSIFSMVDVNAAQVNVHIVDVVVKKEGDVGNENEF